MMPTRMTQTPLADTSVWVEALRYGSTPLPSMTDHDEPIGFTEPVLMELISGCRNEDDSEAVRRLLLRGHLLGFDSAADFDGAAEVYRTSRHLGITPNSHVDCMIIAVAARHDAPLLTLDRQQARIAEVFGVELAS